MGPMWKPSSGIINSARLKSKYDYKCTIRNAVNDYESANADEIFDYLLTQVNNTFWREWNSKYNFFLMQQLVWWVVVIP